MLAVPLIGQASNCAEPQIEIAPSNRVKGRKSFLGLSREAARRPNLAAFIDDDHQRPMGKAAGIPGTSTRLPSMVFLECECDDKTTLGYLEQRKQCVTTERTATVRSASSIRPAGTTSSAILQIYLGPLRGKARAMNGPVFCFTFSICWRRA